VRGLARRVGSVLKAPGHADGKRALATVAWRDFVPSFPRNHRAKMSINS
jgi:hypothetical protein